MARKYVPTTMCSVSKRYVLPQYMITFIIIMEHWELLSVFTSASSTTQSIMVSAPAYLCVC